MKNYYFDLTDVLAFARYNSTLSGIQRVSLRIIGHLIEKHGRERIKLIAFHPNLRRVVEIKSDFLTPDYSFDMNEFAAHCELQTDAPLKSYLRYKYKKSYERRFHRFRLKLLNYATGGRIFKKLGLDGLSAPGGVREVRLTQNDTVIILGATWDFLPFLEYLKVAKSEINCEIVAFIHDLIPIVTPEHVGDRVPDKFYKWLIIVAGLADKFLVNSNHTKKDLSWFFDSEGILHKSISVVPLAHEFIADKPEFLLQHITCTRLKSPEKSPNQLRIRASILNATHLPYALFVGTLESRKNIWTLVNAWKALLDEVGPTIPRLILAGKPGWGKDDADDLLRSTGNLNGHVRICERPLDFELAFLYQQCLFTVFPSYYEGWGLPIGESLWFKKFVITSSNSSMPEVGQDMVDYVDPYSFNSVYNGLKKVILDNEYLKKRTQQIDFKRLRTWEIVAGDLWLALEPSRSKMVDTSLPPPYAEQQSWRRPR